MEPATLNVDVEVRGGIDLSQVSNEYAQDDGTTPAELLAVMVRHHQGVVGLGHVVRALASQRLLLPLLEMKSEGLGEVQACAGLDRSMAAVSLDTPDGPIGLAFSGIPALRNWNVTARPQPVSAKQLAAALVTQSAAALIIDAGSVNSIRIPALALKRLAEGSAWPEPWLDPLVLRALAVEMSPEITAGVLALRPAAPGALAADLLIEVRAAGGGAADVREVARRLAKSAQLREVFDGVLAVRPA